MVKFLLAAFLAIAPFVNAQESGSFNSACFGGLVDADTPATLNPCDSPDLLNTESNLDGTAILKRKGFSKFADLTYATSPVSGSHSFIDSSGNRLDIVCHDRYCAKSTNGNAFSNFLSTAGGTGALPTRWSFVDVGGILYGANDRRDLILRYDGTTRTSAVGIPLGSILELTQDRLAVGDIASQPNRVHYSSAGAYEQFTTGANPEDSFFDEIGTAGDKIRGLKCVGGNCFIFKTGSITLCEMSDQYNTRCSVISPTIGTTDPASIVAAGSDLYFRAQDKNYWRIRRGSLEQISKDIPNFVKSQSGGLSGGENTNIQTTQADWQAGAQFPASSWDTTTTAGSIFPSTVAMTDTSSTNFVAGTLTRTNVTDIDGAVSMSSDTMRDSFEDGDFTVGNSTWTGSVPATGNNDIKTVGGVNYMACHNAYCVIHTTSFLISTGTWKFRYYTTSPAACSKAGDSRCWGFRFVANSSQYYGVSFNNNVVQINKYTGGSETNLAQTGYSLAASANSDWTITRDGSGVITVLIDGVFVSSATDTSITSNTMLEIESWHDTGQADNLFTNLYFQQYKSSGVFFSRVFDSGFSTTTGGPFTVSSSVVANQTMLFQVRDAAAAGGPFTAWTTISSGTNTGLKQRYHQYLSSFTISGATTTPILYSVGMPVVSTGQFTSQCIQPNASITSWGTLSCAETLAGAGSLIYYATSAVNCASLPTSTAPVNAQNAAQAGWTLQTNNATVTIATNSAVFIGWRSLLGSTTDQAQVDACTLSWTEGNPSQPAWAVFDGIKNAVYWTSTINGAASTNRLLKYDRNLESWYPFDIPAQAPKMVNNELYFGGASSGTWNKYGSVDADVGNAINAYWTSKDIGSDRPFNDKDFKTVSILTRNNQSGSMSATWTNAIGNTGTYTISLSTGAGITYAKSNYSLPKKSPQIFMKVRVGNNNSTPFEVLGMGLSWSVLPWKTAP